MEFLLDGELVTIVYIMKVVEEIKKTTFTKKINWLPFCSLKLNIWPHLDLSKRTRNMYVQLQKELHK
jgi:hypothetical protein